MRFAFSIAGIFFLLTSAVPHAVPYKSVPETGRLEFGIFRNDTRIGTHDFSFQRDGDRLIVTARVSIAVKFAFITVYRRTERKREIWQGGVLVGYEHDGDDGGDIERVRAYARGKALIVEDPAGRPPGKLGLLPSTYWNAATVKQTMLLDSTTGEILPIQVSPLGKDRDFPGAANRPAQRFRISLNLARDLWYDDKGKWVGMRLKASDGSIVEYRAN